MRAKEVLQLLNITRPTLCKYVKQGLILIDSEINGQYRYNRERVQKHYLNKYVFPSELDSYLQFGWSRVQDVTILLVQEAKCGLQME